MRFSIITPSLNQGSYLQACLDSVYRAKEYLGQNGEVEHFVMDGGSTDHSASILASQNFALWKSEPDQGQADAINKGFQRSTGDILSYLCADDLLEEDALEKVQCIFSVHPEIDIVYGDGYFLEGDSGWKRRKNAGAFHWKRLRRKNFLIQPAVFFRRRIWERFGPLDIRLRFCMDHEYWLRIAKESQWSYLPEALAVSRLHSDAKTSRHLIAAWKEAAVMQKRYGRVLIPRLEALWMQFGGAIYYRWKRWIFRQMGEIRRR